MIQWVFNLIEPLCGNVGIYLGGLCAYVTEQGLNIS